MRDMQGWQWLVRRFGIGVADVVVSFTATVLLAIVIFTLVGDHPGEAKLYAAAAGVLVVVFWLAGYQPRPGGGDG